MHQFTEKLINDDYIYIIYLTIKKNYCMESI